MLLGDHDHAVGIALQDVARLDPRAADIDRHVEALDLHAVLARAHPALAAVDRVLQRQAQVLVAVDAVDHGAGDAAAVGDLGQDVAPHGGVFTPAIVQHDHAARGHVVDEVAHGAGGIGGGAVQDGEGAAGHAEVRIARLQLVALADNAQTVQGIAQGGGVHQGGAGDIGFDGMFGHGIRP